MADMRDTIKGLLLDRRGGRRRAALYDPDPRDTDLEAHLQEALGWLKRAQDAGSDRGASYGVVFGKDYDLSYPETTGYICQTFVQQGQIRADDDLIDRAVAMADWEIEIQLDSGAVMGGKVNPRPTPAVFNTGMVLLGWSAVLRLLHEERHAIAARRASEWLAEMQDPDGRWRRGNSRYAEAEATLYNVMAAWGLCEAGIELDEDQFVQAAVRNGEYCLSRQHHNGWLPDCCLTDPEAPLLHTLAYAMQGLLEIGKRTGLREMIDGAQLLADALIGVMAPDGFIPGRLRADFAPAADWCCLTGTAQTSIVWSELFLLTRDMKYMEATRTATAYLLARHDIRNTDDRLRGGLPGSWPTWGDYGSLQILNWATKFLVDALSLAVESETT